MILKKSLPAFIFLCLGEEVCCRGRVKCQKNVEACSELSRRGVTGHLGKVLEN